VQSWTPTRPNIGEGRRTTGKAPTQAPVVVHRGIGNSTCERFSEQRGKAHDGRAVATLNTTIGVVTRVGAERLIVLMKSANTEGGKEPRFWVRPRKPRMRRLA